MRVFFLFLLAISFVLSAVPKNFLKTYSEKEYKEACLIGTAYVEDSRDEDFLSAYSFACLNSDNIDVIAAAAIKLKNTKASRQNAAILTSIVAMKKLLYFSVVDGFDISTIKFPEIDHILSKVFTLYTKGRYTLENGIYTFKLKENETATMYLKKDDHRTKLYIKEFRDNKETKTHIYW